MSQVGIMLQSRPGSLPPVCLSKIPKRPGWSERLQSHVNETMDGGVEAGLGCDSIASLIGASLAC